jgi:hypothetical protein
MAEPAGAADPGALFRFFTDPALEAKVVEVVGLYLDLLQNAVVLCADEMSQIQSLDRTAPILPVQPI